MQQLSFGRLRGSSALAVFLTLGVASFALSACSDAASSSSKPQNTSTSVRGALPPIRYAPQVTGSTVVLKGRSVPVPTERPGVPISPGTDTGGQIIVSPNGVLPVRLFVNLGQKITWTNLTSKPVSVHFYGHPVNSGPIASGGTFSYSSNHLEEFNFLTSNGYRGIVAIGAFQSQ